MLWKLLTDKKASEYNNSDQTDSDDDIEANDKFKELELKEFSSPFSTVIYNVNGPNISPSEIVNIAPGEDKILVSFTSEPSREALAFPKDYSTGRNNFNEERKIPTPSKKCCDDRFAANSQYISHALNWIERKAVASSVHFEERKQFQSEINVCQLVNYDNVRQIISDDQLFSSFKNIRGTPQYFHNMLLNEN